MHGVLPGVENPQTCKPRVFHFLNLIDYLISSKLNHIFC